MIINIIIRTVSITKCLYNKLMVHKKKKKLHYEVNKNKTANENGINHILGHPPPLSSVNRPLLGMNKNIINSLFANNVHNIKT